MKIGFRTPSLRKRIAARTSWKRMVRHRLGLKAPRGWGWVTNPKRALYNRIYYRTTIDPIKLLTGGRHRHRRRRRSSGAGLMVLLVLVLLCWLFVKAYS